MADPATAGLVVGGFGALASGVGQAMGGGGGGGGSPVAYDFTQSPELAMDFLNKSYEQMREIETERESLVNAYDSYINKIETIDQTIAAQLPPDEAVKQLAEANMNIVQYMNLGIDEAMQEGLISNWDKNVMEQRAEQIDKMTAETDLYRQQMQALESDTFEDPGLRNQLEDQRAQLQQQLRQQGYGPGAIAQRMAQFDREAEAAMFTRTEQLRSSKGERLTQALEASQVAGGNLAGLLQSMQGLPDQVRQQRMAMLANQLGINQDQLNQVNNLLTAKAGAAQQMVGAEQAKAAAGEAARKAEMDLMGALGQTKLPGEARDALEAGITGPGTVYEQTGVSRNRMGEFKEGVRQGENLASDTGMDRDKAIMQTMNQREAMIEAISGKQRQGGGWIGAVARELDVDRQAAEAGMAEPAQGIRTQVMPNKNDSKKKG